ERTARPFDFNFVMIEHLLSLHGTEKPRLGAGTFSWLVSDEPRARQRGVWAIGAHRHRHPAILPHDLSHGAVPMPPYAASGTFFGHRPQLRNARPDHPEDRSEWKNGEPC